MGEAKLRHFRIRETDLQKLKAIGKSIGLDNDSQALRYLIRNFKVKLCN